MPSFIEMIQDAATKHRQRMVDQVADSLRRQGVLPSTARAIAIVVVNDLISPPKMPKTPLVEPKTAENTHKDPPWHQKKRDLPGEPLLKEPDTPVLSRSAPEERDNSSSGVSDPAKIDRFRTQEQHLLEARIEERLQKRLSRIDKRLDDLEDWRNECDFGAQEYEE